MFEIVRQRSRKAWHASFSLTYTHWDLFLHQLSFHARIVNMTSRMADTSLGSAKPRLRSKVAEPFVMANQTDVCTEYDQRQSIAETARSSHLGSRLARLSRQLMNASFIFRIAEHWLKISECCIFMYKCWEQFLLLTEFHSTHFAKFWEFES